MKDFFQMLDFKTCIHFSNNFIILYIISIRNFLGIFFFSFQNSKNIYRVR